MSTFWSGWVMVLVVLNLGITLFLFIWGQFLRIPTQPDGTTGHVWAHGVLREGVRGLPLWWVLFSAGMFVAGFTYLALYPGFGNFKGVLGWTSAAELQRDTAGNDVRLDPVLARVRAGSVESLAQDAQASAIGQRLFLDNCAACHGVQAQGNQVLGAPNLSDAEWLYAGDAQAIFSSIADGRNGVMPGLGAILGHEGVNEVAAYVVSLSGGKAPADWVAAGKARYETLCFACHGNEGRGNPALGAPDLTDDVWLYGSDFSRIVESVRDGRNGVMPAWRKRLDDEQMRMIAAWVYANAPVANAQVVNARAAQ